MKKISSGMTVFNKKVFPAIWFGFLAFFMLFAIPAGATEENPTFLFVPIGMAVFGFFLMKKLVWDLVDEVHDHGEYLLVKNRGESERIPLTNVMNVSSTSFSNPPRVTLRLVKQGRFGNEIAFQPAGFSLNPFAKNPIAACSALHAAD
jgi:hypothetical protein